MTRGARRMSLLVIDDFPAIAHALAKLLADEADLMVDVATDARTAAQKLDRDHPDVALCDVMLDGQESGLELVQRFGGKGGTAFVMFSAFGAAGLYARAVRHGAAGFVSKTADVDKVLAAIRRAAHDRNSADPEMLQRASMAAREPTTRELEIIRLVSLGRQNMEIAAALGLSVKTIESRLRRLFVTYDVRSRTELSTFAGREGWLTRGDRAAGISS